MNYREKSKIHYRECLEDRLDVGFICAPSISLVAIKNRRCHDDSKIKTKCIFFVATFLIPERTWETLKAIFQIVENRDRCRKCWFIFYGRPRYDRNARHGVATACARKFWNVRKEYCIFFIACIGLKYPRYFKILVQQRQFCSFFPFFPKVTLIPRKIDKTKEEFDGRIPTL